MAVYNLSEKIKERYLKENGKLETALMLSQILNIERIERNHVKIIQYIMIKDFNLFRIVLQACSIHPIVRDNAFLAGKHSAYTGRYRQMMGATRS